MSDLPGPFTLVANTTSSTSQTGTPVMKHHRRPKIASIENQLLSDLLGYSGIILTAILALLFLIRHYLLEAWLFPRFYRRIWTKMDVDTQRGFTNHHIGMGIKLFALLVGAYPWIHILFGNADFQTPMSKHSNVSMGDLLLILTQLFCSMYIFELLFRSKLSPIAVAHHVGAILIAQTGTVLSLDLNHQQDATIEFMLCLVWGAFDVLAELWPNVAIILYRVYNDSHYFLMNVFLGTCLVTICGTVAETIMIGVFLAQSWSRWELAFKIITPILHIVFSMAQLHGSRILYSLYLSQKRKLAEAENRMMDTEAHAQARSKKMDTGDDQITSHPMTDLSESCPSRTAKVDKSSSVMITQDDSENGESSTAAPAAKPSKPSLLGWVTKRA
ncbi:hypothetical protein E2P81_ATG06850 [Venturia nashicola]|uniref:TLC domain-containing protein n=1 Tax=Venturia nashicola TaxID=86259 RepID=A0A4Z1NUY0_9PEZI|nr:hypothetical protein E6O75_ATG07022 [Venturia nashicola]TLD30197.1 hypothetical protein E2P81_ATG06850 [Venturia nashicola]